HRTGRRHHRGGSGDGAAAGRDAGQVVRPGRRDGDRGGRPGIAPAADAGGGGGLAGGAGTGHGATSLNGSGRRGRYTATHNSRSLAQEDRTYGGRGGTYPYQLHPAPPAQPDGARRRGQDRKSVVKGK